MKRVPEAAARQEARRREDSDSRDSRAANILAGTATARIRGHLRTANRAAQAKRDAARAGDKEGPSGGRSPGRPR